MPLTNTLALDFIYDTPPPSNVVARAYYSTNITVPLTNWSVIQTMTNINLGTNTFPARVPLVSDTTHFFAISVSNEWGEVFSDVLGSWPLQGNGIKLRLSR